MKIVNSPRAVVSDHRKPDLPAKIYGFFYEFMPVLYHILCHFMSQFRGIYAISRFLKFHATLWNPSGILSNKLIYVVPFMVRGLKLMRFKVKEANNHVEKENQPATSKE